MTNRNRSTMVVDSGDVASTRSSMSSGTTNSAVTDSDYLSASESIYSVFDQPLSSELLVSLIGPHICWEAAHDMLSGHNALSIAPNQWREPIVETFSPYFPEFDLCKISPGLRGLYIEATQHMGHLRHTDDSPTSSSHDDAHLIQLIEASLVTAEVSECLENTLDTLPRWIAECYLPLLCCAFKTNDLIEDVSLHLPTTPGNRLCDDVFRDESLAVLRTKTANVPAALRLSKDSLSSAVPELPRALASAPSYQLSPRYQVHDLELFSTLVEWHPHHLNIQYQNNSNHHPGLWCHGRMAAISLTRQLHWLSIEAPVIVVQFDFEKVSFHLNWPQLVGERLRCTSAPFWPLDSSRPLCRFEPLFKTWDLRRPAEAVEAALILSNLDRYTSDYFLKQVARRFAEGDLYNCSSRPWKIDTGLLPNSITEVEGSRQWKEEQEMHARREKIPEHPPDIHDWLTGVC